MKKLIPMAATILFLAIVPSAVPAQKGNAAEIKSIEAYCKTVYAIRNRRTNPDLVFADTADINDDKAKWRKFASIKALDKFRKKSETYSIGYAWLNGGKVVASNLTLFSPSGDWVKYLYQYYRTDGTLARVDTDYRTFNGDFKVLRRRYFDRNGKQIGGKVEYLDLKTSKPKDASSGVMGDDPKEVDYYKKTSKLPFARLIRK